MAQKKVRQHSASEGGDRAPAGSPERKGILHLRGSDAFDAWLDGLHDETHIPKMQLVRLGLKLAAQKYGYDAEMPEI